MTTKRFPSPRAIPQPTLFPDCFDKHVSSVGSLRGVVGAFFERATAKLLDLPCLKTDSTKEVCPDFIDEATGDLFETKACGKSGSVILYEHGLKKYQALQHIHTVWHVVWWYQKQLLKFERTGAMYRELATDRLRVSVVPFSFVNYLLRGQSLRVLNRSIRSSAGRSGLGYTIPVNRFFTSTGTAVQGLEVCGRFLEDVVLHFPAGECPMVLA